MSINNETIELTCSGASSNSELSRNPETTEDDLRQLRRVSGAIPWTIYSIAIIEMFERFSFNGTFIVFTNFIQHPLPPGSRTGAGFKGQSGALGMGQRVANAISISNHLWLSIAPLFGAFLADQYLGRYRTLQWSNTFIMIGHVAVLIAALPTIIVHPQWAVTPFLIGVILSGIGFGGIKPNTATLIVEQVPNTECTIARDKNGRCVIIDPEVTRSRVLLYLHSFINIGSIVGMISMVYLEKYVGFWLSFTVPTTVFLLCPLILYWCRNSYVSVTPSGSVLGSAIKLCTFYVKRHWVWNPISFYRKVQDPESWNVIKPSQVVNPPDWMTFQDSWVDEVHRALQACKAFVWFPLYWPTLRQLNNLTSQAATLKLGGLPNDLLVNLNPLFCIVLAPVYAHIVYPIFARFGLRPNPTLRISTGFLSAALGMALCAANQHFIYSYSSCGKYANRCISNPNNHKLSVWIQVPVHILLANSEVLAQVTAIDYAYTNAPKNMRSLAVALFYFTGAFGGAIGQGLIPLSEDPYLVWNYTAAGVLSLVASLGVWWCNRGSEKRWRERANQNNIVDDAVRDKGETPEPKSDQKKM